MGIGAFSAQKDYFYIRTRMLFLTDCLQTLAYLYMFKQRKMKYVIAILFLFINYQNSRP